MWTVFGVLDLVAAVTLGLLDSASAAGLWAGGIDTAPMAQLPISIVPTFFVPFLLVVHVVSLFALRGEVRPANAPGAVATAPVGAPSVAATG